MSYGSQPMRRDDEIEHLESEVEGLRRQIELHREAQFQDKISERKLPPMSGLTRTQRRFFLEPWFTTGMVAGGVLSASSFVTAAVMWDFRPMWIGFIFLVVAGCFGAAKLIHQEANVRVEGELNGPRKTRSTRDDWTY